MRLDEITPLDPATGLCRVIVETPRGSRHKYAFEAELNGFLLKSSLPEGMVFPFDFGFVPRTKGGDGDPLDALVLADSALVASCIVPCRIVGLIEAEQTQENGKKVRNDRFIAVADASKQFGDIQKPADLPRHILEQTEKFFIQYNLLAGKRFKPLRVLGAQFALRHLKANLRRTQDA
jgi:inorganic pyrophosphatase